MDRFMRMRPSPSMVVALIALFVALGGVTWAAIKIPKNSITSKQLKNHKAVQNVDVVPNSLTGKAINESKLGTVRAAKRATSATIAERAANADHATNADNATNAGHATSADSASTVTDGAVTNAKLAAGAVRPEKIGTIPQATVIFTGNQSIPSGASGAELLFDAFDYDSDHLWAVGTPSRLVVPTTGFYAITANVSWAFSTTGVRTVSICRNGAGSVCGSTIAHVLDDAASGAPAQSVSGQTKLFAGEFVHVVVTQTSGAPLDVTSNPGDTNLEMSWVGPG